MKLAIVYCSQTGHTKRYAEWLADEFGITAIPLKQVDSLTILRRTLWCFVLGIMLQVLQKLLGYKNNSKYTPKKNLSSLV